MSKNYDRACRKYEEALTIFRYFYSTNPRWAESGIEDSELKEVVDEGTNDKEKNQIKKLVLQTYLNIAACNIKAKDFETAVQACEEALKIDANNTKALYRKARALTLPINSGIEDFKKAMLD
jgi:tetratricopeptide (TPR) repeat protein